MPLGRAHEFAVMTRRLRAEESIAAARVISFGVGMLDPNAARNLFEGWQADAGIDEKPRFESMHEMASRMTERDIGVAVVFVPTPPAAATP